MLGPLTFQAFADFAMRYTPEEIQCYHHKYFGHMIRQAESLPPGLDRNEAEENLQSWTKGKVRLTRRGGCGVTMLSELTKPYGDKLWRFARDSIKEHMRSSIQEQLEKQLPGTVAHRQLVQSLAGFDAIKSIKWRDFISIQHNFLNDSNRKRSACTDLTQRTKTQKMAPGMQKKGWHELVLKQNTK